MKKGTSEIQPAKGKVFGVPLETVIEQDRKKEPRAVVPIIVTKAVQAITRTGASSLPFICSFSSNLFFFFWLIYFLFPFFPAFDMEGIFRISGNQDRITALKQAIDKGGSQLSCFLLTI
jgi:hypothetical protein